MFGKIQTGAEMRAVAMDHAGLGARFDFGDDGVQFFDEGVEMALRLTGRLGPTTATSPR
ncbi:MAG: hypothetical protein R3D60_11195 [Paracoccaceae bacterium]